MPRKLACTHRMRVKQLIITKYYLPPSLERHQMALSIETTLSDLFDNVQSKAILEKHIPGISTHPQISMGLGFPLSLVANYSSGLITQEMLTAVQADLAALS
jgi:hypothetical protein